MKTINQIFESLGQNIVDNLEEGWSEAEIHIKVLPDFSSYKGYYTQNGERFSIKVSNFSPDTGDNLRDLNVLTAREGQERWNKAVFKISSDHEFDIQFIWDQDLQNEIDRNQQV